MFFIKTKIPKYGGDGGGGGDGDGADGGAGGDGVRLQTITSLSTVSIERLVRHCIEHPEIRNLIIALRATAQI